MATTQADHDHVHSGLSTRSIVGAAVQIADAEGLAALTMRRLGHELDVKAMSIYHHVPNKSALLDLMIVRLVDSIEDVESWSTPLELIEAHCRHVRAAILAHPQLAPIVAERMARLARSAAITATIARALVGAGFDHEAAAWIVETFVAFAIGHSVVEVTTIDSGATDDDAVFDTGLRFMLVGLRDELGA